MGVFGRWALSRKPGVRGTPGYPYKYPETGGGLLHFLDETEELLRCLCDLQTEQCACLQNAHSSGETNTNNIIEKQDMELPGPVIVLCLLTP